MLENIKVKIPTFTTVPVTNVGALILSANPRRMYAFIQNNSNTDIWIMLGSQGALSAGILVPSNGFSYEIDRNNLWQGTVYAIHGSGASKNVHVLDCN
jgi:hypothetical protein